ncbi:MAG: terminase large subunit [Candidatus Ventricola sp.]
MSALEYYATSVLDGKIAAPKRIKQQYRRLLYWLYNPGQWHYDQTVADKHIGFMERFCIQPESGKPLHFELFQRAKFEAVFGFVDDYGLRQCQECLTIEGRKNGKTTEMAAVELDLLINDGEGAPQVYNVATKLDQAKLGFNAAWAMVRRSPHLSRHIRKRVADLYFPYNMGIIKALASNSNSLDGLNASGVVIDELAAIKNRDLYDLMKQSMSAREQPLLFCITTNGFVRDNIYDSQYEYACGVLDEKIDDPRFFAFIYELDDPDEWTDERCWIKANPGLGTIKSVEFLRDCVKKAIADDAFKPTVMVKDFNLKQTGASAWLRWEELDNDETFDIREFDYAIGGFDAADTTDLNSARVMMQRPDDPKIYTQSMYWIPESVLEQIERTGLRRERDNMPYDLWVKQGLMRTWPGNKVDKSCFFDWFSEMREEHDLYTLFIGYDPWHIDDSLLSRFKQAFGAKSMIPVRQGIYSLSDPMKELKADLQAHRVVYQNNPIDKMCFANTEIKVDINGNIQPVKSLDQRKRIDGTVSMLCAYKTLRDHREEYVNLNETR